MLRDFGLLAILIIALGAAVTACGSGATEVDDRTAEIAASVTPTHRPFDSADYRQRTWRRPPTLTPTSTITLTPSNTPTPTPTEYPYATPVLNWSDEDFRYFLGVGSTPGVYMIFTNWNFIRKFHCPAHGHDWATDVDPFVVKYFSGVQACTLLHPEEGPGITILVPDAWGLNPDSARTREVEETGEYNVDYFFYYWPVEMTSEWNGIDPDYSIISDDIPAWEWCLFLERNYHIYGRHNNRNAHLLPEESGVGMFAQGLPGLEAALGNPSGAAGRFNPSGAMYCPNFDPSHPLYLVETGDEMESWPSYDDSEG